MHLSVERSAALGALRARQTDQVVSAPDTDRDTTVKELLPQEPGDVPVEQPKTQNTATDDDRDRQDEVACQLTNGQSKAPDDLPKSQRRRQGKCYRDDHCHKVCRSSNELARGSSHRLATVLLTWKQFELRVTSHVEMTNRAAKSSKEVSQYAQERAGLGQENAKEATMCMNSMS
jgi:hypothetical protein